MSNKREKLLTIIGVMTLLLFGVGATFAYFVAQDGNAEQTNINVTTHTTDSLVFEVGKAISITADQTTFAPGAGNRADDTFARATLKANSSTNSATEHYYVYLNIDTNEFKYTTDIKTAELILTVNYKDTNGNVTPVTSINGLNYVTVGSVGGFDITEANNLITIANNHEITTTGTKVDEWNITLTLVNLDSNQTANAGKTFNATLIIQKQPVASQYIASLFTTQGENHLYHHDGTITDAEGNIMDAEDGSYRYAGGDYKVAEAYKDAYETISDIIKYELDNESGTYYEYYLVYDTEKTHYDNPQKVIDKAISDGYIENDSVDNFVCFGTDNDTCDNNHLYRIIGVYEDNIKLIKADFATEDELGTDGSFGYTLLANDYFENIESGYVKSKNEKYSLYTNSFLDDSTLNKVNLNYNYLNYLGNIWTEKITNFTWYIGGLTYVQGTRSNAKIAYESELGKNKIVGETFETSNAKIGLMYVSDFYYSALPNYWELPGINDENREIGKNSYIYAGESYSKAINENWLYMFDTERLISQIADSDKSIGVSATLASGMGIIEWVDYPTALHVRPTFYLKPTITFAGGFGTSTDPYRIK